MILACQSPALRPQQIFGEDFRRQLFFAPLHFKMTIVISCFMVVWCRQKPFALFIDAFYSWGLLIGLSALAQSQQSFEEHKRE